MNLNEYKGSFLFKSPSSSSHSFIPNTAKLGMFTYNYQHTVFHISNFWSHWSLGKNLDFLVHWNLMFKHILITKPKQIKFYSVRALEHHLNEKNLIHSQVMLFSPQIFETYFGIVWGIINIYRIQIKVSVWITR